MVSTSSGCGASSESSGRGCGSTQTHDERRATRESELVPVEQEFRALRLASSVGHLDRSPGSFVRNHGIGLRWCSDRADVPACARPPRAAGLPARCVARGVEFRAARWAGPWYVPSHERRCKAAGVGLRRFLGVLRRCRRTQTRGAYAAIHVLDRSSGAHRVPRAQRPGVFSLLLWSRGERPVLVPRRCRRFGPFGGVELLCEWQLPRTMRGGLLGLCNV
jgi:hypothetical protein